MIRVWIDLPYTKYDNRFFWIEWQEFIGKIKAHGGIDVSTLDYNKMEVDTSWMFSHYMYAEEDECFEFQVETDEQILELCQWCMNEGASYPDVKDVRFNPPWVRLKIPH